MSFLFYQKGSHNQLEHQTVLPFAQPDMLRCSDQTVSGSTAQHHTLMLFLLFFSKRQQWLITNANVA